MSSTYNWSESNWSDARIMRYGLPLYENYKLVACVGSVIQSTQKRIGYEHNSMFLREVNNFQLSISSWTHGFKVISVLCFRVIE